MAGLLLLLTYHSDMVGKYYTDMSTKVYKPGL